MDRDPSAIVRKHADLRILAQECKSISARIDNKDRDILTEYRELGERLIQVKGIVKHGEYGPWLDQHGITKDRSSRAVNLAENWTKIRGPRNLEDALTQCDAVRYCSDPKPVPVIITSAADTSDDDDVEQTPAASPPPAKPATPSKPAAAKPPAPEPEPEPEYPPRVKPYLESAPLFREIAQKAIRLGNLLDEAEKTPAYKAVHEGQEITVYSSTVRLIATNYEHDAPVRPCPDGCAEVEPSDDADVCPKCRGKGYQTQDDIDHA